MGGGNGRSRRADSCSFSYPPLPKIANSTATNIGPFFRKGILKRFRFCNNMDENRIVLFIALLRCATLPRGHLTLLSFQSALALKSHNFLTILRQLRNYSTTLLKALEVLVLLLSVMHFLCSLAKIMPRQILCVSIFLHGFRRLR
jgi:hypothetical protein